MPIQKITSGVIESSQTLTTPTISGNLSLDSTGTTGVRVPSANTLAFYTAGTEDVRIDSSGNVGIGTTSPAGATGFTADRKILHIIPSSGTSNAQVRLGGTSGTIIDHDDSNNTITTIRNLYGASSASAAMQLQSGYMTFGTGTSYTERMRIDSSGRVTMPYQPAFDAYSNAGGVTFTTEAAIAFNSTTFNVGNHYNTSNYRFTAPVTGIYFFRAHVYKQSSGNASRLRLQKNAADVRFYTYISSSDTYTHQITGIISLTAGDYVTCTFGSDGAGTSIYLADNHSNFSGYLLG